jgi:hypothetical protein
MNQNYRFNYVNTSTVFINILLLLIIYVLIIYLIFKICKNKKINSNVPMLSLLYHSLFSLLFYYSTRSFQADADAIQYYLAAQTTKLSFMHLYGYGSEFIIFLLYPLIKYFKLTYFSGFMIFNIIGYLGIFIFYLTLKELIGEDRRANLYLTLAIFIPGLNYWTSMIGKDPLIILAISLILYSITNITKRFPFLFIGMGLMGHVRPHILIIVLFSISFGLLFAKNIKIGTKIVIIILLIPLMIKTYFVFIDYVHISELNYGVIDQQLSDGPTSTRGGSTIDISNYNIFIRMIFYLYRPLFYDAYNITTFVSSIENLLYLIISISMIRLSFIKFIVKEGTLFMRFNILFMISGLIILSSSTANLGTAFRQKNMLTLSLISMFILFTANRVKISKFAATVKQKIYVPAANH